MRSIQRRTGVLIIAAMVGAVLFLSVPGQQMWRKVLQDAGHGPVFAVIAVVLALMRLPEPASQARSLRILLQSFLVAVAIGASTEAVQFLEPGRTVSLLDVMHDAAGAALGLAALSIAERLRMPKRIAFRSTATIVALLAFTVLARDPVQCVLAYRHRAELFPILAQGASDRDLYFVRGHEARVARTRLPDAFVRPGEPDAIQVTYTDRDHPRFELYEPTPDWRGRHRLKIDLTNPSAVALQVVLKVQDAEHNLKTNDRLNLHLVVAAASRTVIDVPLSTVESAPVGRKMDLARMANVALYTFGPARAGEFYVSRVWLE